VPYGWEYVASRTHELAGKPRRGISHTPVRTPFEGIPAWRSHPKHRGGQNKKCEGLAAKQWLELARLSVRAAEHGAGVAYNQ